MWEQLPGGEGHAILELALCEIVRVIPHVRVQCCPVIDHTLLALMNLSFMWFNNY
jgi:hypothetical protein